MAGIGQGPAMAGQVVKREESEMNLALNRQAEIIERLDNSIQKLRNRLHPILVELPPEPNVPLHDNIDGHAVPLIRTINCHTLKIDESIGRIHTILDLLGI